MARQHCTRAAFVLGLILIGNTAHLQAQLCIRTPEHRIPLTDPGGLGLYDGTNIRPEAHTNAGIAASARILDNGGRPIVFIGVGQSVTKNRVKQLMNQNGQGHHGNVVIHNCALNGYTAEKWAHPNLKPWLACRTSLAAAGLLPTDVRAVYMEFTRQKPAPPLTEDQFHVLLLQEWRQAIANGRSVFTKWEETFVSGRTAGVWDQAFYNGEPYAWRSNLVARQLVLDSIAGQTAGLWIDWGQPAPGMYLWADGEIPRAIDGFDVTCDPNPYKNGVPTFDNGDVQKDMIHQTKKGKVQEGALMQATLELDPATAWWRQ